jgi:hypothetical protein
MKANKVIAIIIAKKEIKKSKEINKGIFNF